MHATLASLRIRNLALVEELHWQLTPGFVAITGETGAGKSVVLGALKLLLGERADKGLVRTGADSCTVEAVFEVRDAGDTLDPLLVEHGLDPCAENDGQLIIKRSFTTAGGNRQFVNGSPTTLAVLKRLGEELVDLHGPHDHQSLLSAERQLDLLDAFGRSEPARRAYEDCFRRLGSLRSAHAGLATDEAAQEREIDLLRHQFEEIDAAHLQPGEEEALQSRYALAANARRLTELATAVVQELTESEPSILSRLADTARLLRELEKIDPTTAGLARAHGSAVLELEELARALAGYGDRLELDPAQLAALEERVSLLETLKRKYGPTLEAVSARGEEAAARLQRLEGRGTELARLQREIGAAEAELRERGQELSGRRREAAPALAATVAAQLRDLGFKKSEFQIHLLGLETPGARGLETVEFVFAPRSRGLESVEFLFAPNPGEPPKPLRSIASSGEISRVMLAVKSALADQDAVSLLVFDEIDANVGGEIAHAVGKKMRALGTNHQVLCITHLPQVAALAETHFVVSKEFTDERTYSRLTRVAGKEREREVARMLGGRDEATLTLARTLLTRRGKAG